MIDRRYFVALAFGILAVATAVKPVDAQQQGAVRVPRSVLERYVGEYDQNGSIIKITVSGDTLFRESAGQRVAFTPISETKFRTGPVFTAEFVTDKSGGVTQVVTDGAAVEFRIPRKGSKPIPAPAVKAKPVRKSVLQRYVGVYEFIPGQMKRTDLIVVIRLRGDTLIRAMSGLGETVLTPVSETRFKVGDTALFTEFVIDDAGVTQVMGTGFQQMLTRLNPSRSKTNE